MAIPLVTLKSPSLSQLIWQKYVLRLSDIFICLSWKMSERASTRTCNDVLPSLICEVSQERQLNTLLWHNYWTLPDMGWTKEYNCCVHEEQETADWCTVQHPGVIGQVWLQADRCLINVLKMTGVSFWTTCKIYFSEFTCVSTNNHISSCL